MPSRLPRCCRIKQSKLHMAISLGSREVLLERGAAGRGHLSKERKSNVHFNLGNALAFARHSSSQTIVTPFKPTPRARSPSRESTKGRPCKRWSQGQTAQAAVEQRAIGLVPKIRDPGLKVTPLDARHKFIRKPGFHTHIPSSRSHD